MRTPRRMRSAIRWMITLADGSPSTLDGDCDVCRGHRPRSCGLAQHHGSATSADGSFSTQAYSIAVNDVDEFRHFADCRHERRSRQPWWRTRAAGTMVGITSFASDSDATTNAISYSLDDDAGGLFAIDPINGVITVAVLTSISSPLAATRLRCERPPPTAALRCAGSPSP